MKLKLWPWAGAVLSLPLFILGSIAMGRQGPPPPLGGPLPGLTAEEFQAFQAGRAEFTNVERPEDGLGPVFNGRACAECHRSGAIGGASLDLRVSRVTKIGATVNGIYTDLTQFGGAVLQARSLREIIPNYPIPGEVVPPQARYVSRRITTPVFGAGLIEAIPDEAIVALSQQTQPDGIHGVPNYVHNPDTDETEVGKFGWKAQVSTLHWFAGDAYLNEMGITSPTFPTENLPQGHQIPPGADRVADPEDDGTDVNKIVDFMRFLAPAHGGQPNPRGQQLFGQIHCASCHTPVQFTGDSDSQALAHREVRLYSDLLLHRMGPALADGLQQGTALGDQWRTAPLWGVGRRPFLLHDGRARTIDQAIRLHAGEATAAVNRYIHLSTADRNSLIQFVGSL